MKFKQPLNNLNNLNNLVQVIFEISNIIHLLNWEMEKERRDSLLFL